LEPLEDRLVLSSPASIRPGGPLPIFSPQANYSLENGVLTINGDQDWQNENDAFAVNATANGGLAVTFNGQVLPFDPYAVSNIILNTGGGNNFVQILGTGLGPADLYVNSGGNDTVQVGNGMLTGICAVHVSNPSYYTNLTIDDSADTQPNTPPNEVIMLSNVVSFAQTSVSLDYCQLSGLNVFGGSGGNTFVISDTPNVYDPSTGSPGFVNLHTGAGNDNVYVSGTEGALRIDGDAGHDSVRIGASDPVIPVGLGMLDNIHGAITVVNTQGGTDLSVEDGSYYRLTSISRHATLTDGSLTGMAPGAIYWTPYSATSGGVLSLSIYGSPAGNTFTVQNTSDLYHGTTINTGDAVLGPNSVTVAATTGFLNINTGMGASDTPVTIGNVAAFSGTSSFHGGTLANINGAIYMTSPVQHPAGTSPPGRIVLTLNDGGDAAQRTVQFTDAEISGLFPAPIYTYQSLRNLTVYGSKAPSTYDFSALMATLPIALFGGASVDTLLGPNTGGTWLLTGINAGQFNGFLTFSGIEGLLAGLGDDTFKFLPGALISSFINGGGGNNTVDFSANGRQAVTVNLAANLATMGSASYGFANFANVIGSTSSGDTLIGPNTTNLWRITGLNTGRVQSSARDPRLGTVIITTVQFSGIENLTGGTQTDVFQFSPAGAIAGSINGGGGGDWLDYSACTTAVTVNLATGAATRVANGAAGAVTQIQNVIGSAGNDNLTGNALGNILIGGAGTNIITGGSGRSLLIGGTGTTAITGGSGGDILIAGTTTFDGNETALMAILKEWQRTDKTYAQRIADLKNGGGFNGTNKLIWGSTVLDNDAASAKLTGGAGLDWFFANLGPGGLLDHIINRTNGEQVD
jgi:hypothetical protein